MYFLVHMKIYRNKSKNANCNRGKLLDCLLQENKDLGILQTDIFSSFFFCLFSEDIFDGENSTGMVESDRIIYLLWKQLMSEFIYRSFFICLGLI